MKAQKTSELYDQKRSVEFYEDRYKKDYMDEWPIEKKRKIFEVIQELQLPAKSDALDFGCGNGVLTEIIRQALPSWKIYGTDISKKAVAYAKVRYPGCVFFEASNPYFIQKKFDFVFTHHIFEHVFNLSEVFNQMNEYLKPESSMLHFLPCGNEGSYEYNICLLRKDGINTDLENRFFFEDEGHVRRLTTDEFCRLCQTKGFELQKEFYSNQRYGAIEWITNSNPKFVLMFSDSSQAINKKAKRKLKKARMYLILITALRLPSQIVTKLLKKRNKQLKHYILLLIGLPFSIFSSPIDKYWKKKAKEEWDTKKFERNGSEMCLYFKRG
jgi:trans-aconitate methyltransferase